ncbi:MAG: hypothetical protein JST93_26300 [Acidobacteria bacterium]|nr:hypothetical protein [Acidobacteriota bacterium]
MSSIPADPISIQKELRQILESSAFANAARSRRFLQYVVDRTLEGNAASIKESVLGVDVFDRPPDFDPKTDTIVRVEAGKLRKRLEEYYQTEGASSGLRIQIPKGAYIPEFQTPAPEPEQPTQPPATPPRTHLRPILAAAILLTSLAIWWLTRTPSPQPEAANPSVVVLPFLNLSTDPANGYFADGLTEDLTNALARTGSLSVVARTSAFTLKGKQEDVRSIGQRFHAAYVVEGSARREGQRIKISAQLIRTSDAKQLWSSAFERDLTDVFAVQAEISQAVTNALQRTLTTLTSKPFKPLTVNPQAFDLYLRARHAAGTGILLDYTPVESLFRQSIQADPSYALPYLGLAEMYVQADILQVHPTQSLVKSAKAALAQAFERAPDLARTQVLMGSIAARHDYDWSAAASHFEKAIQLDPNLAAAHYSRAVDLLALQSRWREATAELNRAQELDPYSPVITIARPWLLCLQRQFDACLTQAQELRTAFPNSPSPQILISAAQLGKGDLKAATATFEKLLPSPIAQAFLAHCQARTGHRAEAEQALSRLTAASNRAIVYAGLGDIARAIEWLDKARLNQESYVGLARVSPELDPLRNDPRFRALLDTIGLSDAALNRPR